MDSVDERYARQSFLGDGAQDIISKVVVGVVGLGGGGSHIVQQLAHIGFKRYVLFDADIVEESNLNRLVGATRVDVAASAKKLDVAKRVIDGLVEDAEIEGHAYRWQDAGDALVQCDLVFGCVDGFLERDQLEASCRRHLIPLIDIGMDVVIVDGEPPVMGGQVILSMPGGPCMKCMGFLTDENLAKEGQRYGDAGANPQVVWANGILASTAISVALDLVTNWRRQVPNIVFLEYRGNEDVVREHPRSSFVADTCPHYELTAIGHPRFAAL